MSTSENVLKMTKRTHAEGSAVSVTADPNFLGTAFARKVYGVNGVFKFPNTAHYHQATELVVPLFLEGRFAAGFIVDDAIRYQELEVGYMYEFAPMVPHQLWATGRAVIEVWFPTQGWLGRGLVGQTERDLFGETDAVSPSRPGHDG